MPKTEIDTVAVADKLRPALLRVGRELRREARDVGVSPEQVSLLVTIKYAPGIGVRELAARGRPPPGRADAHRRGPARVAPRPLAPHRVARVAPARAQSRRARRGRG